MTFLTGIPLKVEGDVSPSDLWRSMGWYPLVGLAMGAAAWAVYAGLSGSCLASSRRRWSSSCSSCSRAGCTWTA